MDHKTSLGRIIMGVDGKVTHVKCKVCNVMEMRNKFWCPNWIICGNMLVKRSQSCIYGCGSGGFLPFEN